MMTADATHTTPHSSSAQVQEKPTPRDEKTSLATALPCSEDQDTLVGLMELLFFAYRDFIAEPDAMLAELGFGRAHHRILHFVGRHPGLRVSELLAILRITKQSLGRVLRELVERGYVVQQEGATDRRQRLLHLTPAGQALLQRLEAPQVARVHAALQQAGPAAREAFARTLLALVDTEQRQQVAQLCGLHELLQSPGTVPEKTSGRAPDQEKGATHADQPATAGRHPCANSSDATPRGATTRPHHR